MVRSKIKGHKPEYKTKFKRKNQSDADRFFEKLFKESYEKQVLREELIDNQIDKLMYGN